MNIGLQFFCTQDMQFALGKSHCIFSLPPRSFLLPHSCNVVKLSIKLQHGAAQRMLDERREACTIRFFERLMFDKINYDLVHVKRDWHERNANNQHEQEKSKIKQKGENEKENWRERLRMGKKRRTQKKTCGEECMFWLWNFTISVRGTASTWWIDNEIGDASTVNWECVGWATVRAKKKTSHWIDMCIHQPLPCSEWQTALKNFPNHYLCLPCLTILQICALLIYSRIVDVTLFDSFWLYLWL